MQVELRTNLGDRFIVDASDVETVSKYTWTVAKNGYLYGYKKGSGRGSKRVLLHRILLLPGELIVDHVDLNKLNNSRSNLRLANKALNSINRVKRNQKTSSKFKGVHYCKRTMRWVAQCGTRWIGRFSSEGEAAMAYDRKAVELYGDRIALNFGGAK